MDPRCNTHEVCSVKQFCQEIFFCFWKMALMMAIVTIGSIAFVIFVYLIGASRRMQQAGTPTQQPIHYAIYTNCRGHSVYNSGTILFFKADADHYQQNANAEQHGDDMPEADRFPVQETRPDGTAELV